MQGIRFKGVMPMQISQISVNIRPVNAFEAQLISKLAIRSKAYWGYDEKFMDSWVDELSH